MPECAGSYGPFCPITPDVADQPAEPDSKPGFAIFWPEEQVVAAVTVRLNVVLCVAVEPAPVIVTVYVPAGVELDVATVSVDDDPAVTDVGENVAVAPLGSPLALRATDCAEPDVTAVATVAPVLPPAVTLPDAGLTASEKSLGGALVTLSVSVAVCEPDAAVPVIVTLYVPGAADEDAASVSVDADPELVEPGENDAVTPLGSPLAPNETVSELPDVTAVETVAVPFDPAATLTFVGLTEIEKSLGCVDAGPSPATPFGVPSPVGPS